MNRQPVVDSLAERLDTAQLTATACAQLSDEHDLSLDEAYAVQRAVLARRVARGERIAGVKLGFTSRAKAEQMGVSDVIIGQLSSAMLVDDGGAVDHAGLVHPRVEPEVAFRLSRTIEPGDPVPGPRAVVDAVAPALEIIDSRYRDFEFDLTDVVADNTSAAHAVIAAWQDASRPLGDLPVVLELDGRVVATGSTDAILGDPWQAVAAAIRLAHTYGIPLPAGTVLLAGAATEAVAVPPGAEVRARVDTLGEVTVRLRGGTDGQQ
ncbi:fumarylacetoacetate hydrolase family protein [Amycolatopsis sp. NPDC006131]|uniref:2-keto-4-pentenoate hydratase n=1 Tax=Amycolatopsis sp. NPDC006131 TaxID=3156731 RepID=UPI0033A51FB4